MDDHVLLSKPCHMRNGFVKACWNHTPTPAPIVSLIEYQTQSTRPQTLSIGVVCAACLDEESSSPVVGIECDFEAAIDHLGP